MRGTMLTIVVLLAAAGCKQERVMAKVNCEVVAGTGGAPAVECTAQQTQGKTDVEVCWDFKVTCDSGATLVTPHTCTHVANGGTSKTTIPGDKLTITGNCTGAKHGSLGTLTIDGKPSEI